MKYLVKFENDNTIRGLEVKKELNINERILYLNEYCTIVDKLYVTSSDMELLVLRV